MKNSPVIYTGLFYIFIIDKSIECIQSFYCFSSNYLTLAFFVSPFLYIHFLYAFFSRKKFYYIYLNPQGTESDIIAKFGDAGKRMLDSYRSIGILSGSAHYRTTAFGKGQIDNSMNLHMLSGE